MRTTRALLAIALILSALTVAALELTSVKDRTDKQSLAHDQFIVHEWGTFTSFSGSDAVKLEFRPLVDSDLPPFVLDRGHQSGIPYPFGKLSLRALQRMETPISYFYSDRERQASVRVGFPQGLLTEFFPPVERMQPEFDWNKPQPLSASALDWGKVWIVPENRLHVNVSDPQLAQQMHSRLLQRLLPASTDHEHYAFARETDSALVYVERPGQKQRPLAPHGAFFEKFLFYRGVGNFELPLKIAALPGERYELHNVGANSIRPVFLVTVEDKQLRFVKYDGIQPGKMLTMIQSEKTSSPDELAEAIVAALVEEKLYEKEARAMVKTWRSSWFGEEGTRLLYVLPRTITDELLPLEIDPLPDEVIRVMVGRLEIMRPEDEARVAAVVKQSMHDRAAAQQRLADDPKSEPYAIPQAILDLGRLAEPALVRVKNIGRDAEVCREANLLLLQLRQYQDALAATSP